jgi:hypothetical protein
MPVEKSGSGNKTDLVYGFIDFGHFLPDIGAKVRIIAVLNPFAGSGGMVKPVFQESLCSPS